LKQLIAKPGVEALDVAVLPRATSLDVSGLGTDNRDPFLHGLDDELRSVVGPDVSGNAPQDEEVGQNVDHIDRNARSRAVVTTSSVSQPILSSLPGNTAAM
jgi:hypothetical protein